MQIKVTIARQLEVVYMAHVFIIQLKQQLRMRLAHPNFNLSPNHQQSYY
jgi:hypothetical protein